MSGNISRSNNHPSMVQNWPAAGDAATDPTTVAATANNTSVSNHLSRVTRPLNARKRSRASRRAPTTLLNTDTANFRAMVQRFTGGGNSGTGSDATSAPFRSNESTVASSHQFLNTYNSNSSSFNDGFGSINTGVAVRSDERYNSVQFSPPQNHPYFTMTAVDHGGSMTDHDGDDQHVGFRPTGSYNW